jgi:xylulokinase
MADASGRFMPIAVTLNATKITDWAARILNCDLHELDKLALDSEVKSNNMTLVSYFDGERTPNYPYARGVLAGIDNDQSRENFARMSYEGVLLGLIKAFKHLTNLGITTNKRIIVTGGGARGSAYPQILSDLLGREVITLDVEESSARGACVLAAAIATKTPVADVAYKWSPKEKSIFKPKQKVDLALLLQKYEKLSNFREMDRVSN